VNVLDTRGAWRAELPWRPRLRREERDLRLLRFFEAIRPSVARFVTMRNRRRVRSMGHGRTMVADIFREIQREPVMAYEESEFGTIFMVELTLTGPSGITADVVSVWIVLYDTRRPRLVTVYPSRG